ncbi:hypothetical protein CFI00_17200 [Nocardioides sp. S5]|uniref:hypothetical protein n=1 Tax=Nocardioides sp. S5 TaxID=2017486 RepID=UPI001A8C8A47|nr:hypothetical protein [Nocardioides sp. S5]QSR32200.1 hypothetical protein CFI00_17200 [Nocardioides sp. S5]
MFGFYRDIYIYVPRHDRRTFVTKVDFATAVPPEPSRGQGRKPYRVVSNLGVFWFVPGKGLEVESLHSGVAIDDVRDATSFPVISGGGRITSPPTTTDLDFIREVIDPLGARDLEFMDSRSRRDLIRTIYAKERLS